MISVNKKPLPFHSPLKEITVAALLEREPIQLNNKNIKKSLRGKRVLVTGAAGSIGYELAHQIASCKPALLIMVDKSESALYSAEEEVKLLDTEVKVLSCLADITNTKRMETIFANHQPELTYHAAAYKHIYMMEKNPSEAVSCNILGTKIVADLAVKYHTQKFVMISTDKAVNPTNVMGRSKRIAEIYVQSLNEKSSNFKKTLFITTRFGNVMGSNGSVIPLFRKQIKAGGPVTITHPDIQRFFMTIPEACQLVLEAGVMGKRGEIFIFDMGSPIKIVDLAKKMIRLSGFEPYKDIGITFTGMRNGEKLYEELTSVAEDTLPTYNDKILIAKVKPTPHVQVQQCMNLFHSLLCRGDIQGMNALMQKLAPRIDI